MFSLNIKTEKVDFTTPFNEDSGEITENFISDPSSVKVASQYEDSPVQISNFKTELIGDSMEVTDTFIFDPSSINTSNEETPLQNPDVKTEDEDSTRHDTKTFNEGEDSWEPDPLGSEENSDEETWSQRRRNTSRRKTIAKKLVLFGNTQKDNKKTAKVGAKDHIRVDRFQRYDKKTIDEACRLLKEGVETATVAQKFGVGVKLVRGWRVQYIPKEERVFRTSRAVSNEQFTEACDLIKQGASYSFLAARYGVKEYTIRKWRRKYVKESLNVSSSSKYDNDTVLKVCRLLRDGNSIDQVAATVGIAYKAVNMIQDRFLQAKLEESTPDGAWQYNRYTKLEACCKLKQGASIKSVAKELNIDKIVLHKWEEENYIEVKSEPEETVKPRRNFQGIVKKSEPDVKIEILPKIEDGQPVKYYVRNKVEVEDGLRIKKETKLKACELLERGEKIIEVARKLKLNENTVGFWRRRYFTEVNGVSKIEIEEEEKL